MHRDSIAVGIAAVDFGWGSAGKVAAIAESLRRIADAPVRFVGISSKVGRPIIPESLAVEWVNLDDVRQGRRPVDIDVLISVLDRDTPALFRGTDVPVVFVDSLPYLWREADLATLPVDATAYCAQLFGYIPFQAAPVLRAIKNLIWVSAVVDAPQNEVERRSGGTVVLNLGGLVAPSRSDPSGYVKAVLGPALSAVARVGYRSATVCGNIAEVSVEDRVEIGGLEISWSCLNHHEFGELLGNSELLLTSPGLTTLLEASARGVRIVCLPPQNVSQIANCDEFKRTTGSNAISEWPTGVIDSAELERAMNLNESEALEIMYAGIDRAAGDSKMRSVISTDIEAAIRLASNVPEPQGLVNVFGVTGALEVARIVHSVIADRST